MAARSCRINRSRFHFNLHRIGGLMVDAQFVNEAVSNALKLLGDQFLARVYAIAARRFGLDRWGQNIREKIGVLHALYTTTSDRAHEVRAERLEWIVIILIFFEILWSMFGHG